MTAKERLIQLLNRCETEDVEPAYRCLPVGNPRYTEIKADAILKEFVRREDVEMIIKKLVSIIEYPNDKEEIIDFKEFKKFALKQAKEFNGKGWVAKGE